LLEIVVGEHMSSKTLTSTGTGGPQACNEDKKILERSRLLHLTKNSDK
jgi:hypothetical protein